MGLSENDKLITEARELCENATPGPWRTKDRGNYIEIHDNNTWAKALSPFARVEGDETDSAEFIARSRTLIPELCDALEKAEAEIEKMKPFYTIADDTFRHWENAAYAMRDDERKKHRWIPVTEGLPEPETNVLICQHYHEDAPYAKITIGHLHQDGDLRHKPYWNWIAHGADMVHPKIEAYHRAEFICPGKEFVTHWMPLPAPPEEGAEK